jgi:hypothetical protein
MATRTSQGTCAFFWALKCDHLGLQFENSSDIGVFSKLTNTYCLVAVQGSTNFYSAFESELQDVVPIVHSTIGGTRIIGRLTAGALEEGPCENQAYSFQATDTVSFYPLQLPTKSSST